MDRDTETHPLVTQVRLMASSPDTVYQALAAYGQHLRTGPRGFLGGIEVIERAFASRRDKRIDLDLGLALNATTFGGWRRLVLCAWLAALTACGGGSGSPAANSPVAPVPPAPAYRVQDARAFQAPIETTLAPLEGATVETDRWVGQLEGAAYRIEVPKVWNGILVIWARGYWNGIGLYIEDPFIRRHLIQNGYAWAASSYTRNFYDVNVGIEDSNKLAAQFQTIAAQRGRLLAEPRRTLIVGASMGGHVAASAVEAEVQRDARTPRRYDGALALCGSLTDVEWHNYVAAYQLALQHLLGAAAESYPSSAFTASRASLQGQVINAVNQGDLSDPRLARLYALMENLSGGPRPFYKEGWGLPYHHNILFSLMNAAPTLEGILAKPALDTRGVSYAWNGNPNDADARQFNDTILRLTPDADPNPLQRPGLRWLPTGTGQLTAPVMTLHTLGDLTVPIDVEVRYRQRVERQGAGALLTQRVIRDVGHCAFTAAEMTSAFDDLVNWVERGDRPRGDDLLVVQAWRGPTAGCASTVNHASTDDRTDVQARRRLQAAYPACPSNRSVLPGCAQCDPTNRSAKSANL